LFYHRHKKINATWLDLENLNYHSARADLGVFLISILVINQFMKKITKCGGLSALAFQFPDILSRGWININSL